MASPLAARRRTRRARRSLTSLYGLPLPTPRFGVGSVLAVGGTGRLARLARSFGEAWPGDRFDMEALSADAAGSLRHLEALMGPR